MAHLIFWEKNIKIMFQNLEVGHFQPTFLVPFFFFVFYVKGPRSVKMMHN
jgi:hypothetical protein